MNWKHVVTRVRLVAGALALGVFGTSMSGMADVDNSRWELIWSDEFDYEGQPDPAKWNYEEGFVRNREAQFYTRDRRENARVANGHLVIEGRRESWPNPRHDPEADRWQALREFAEYTSASLTTADRFTFRYGRVEVRAKLPHGLGVWPAIWTLGENIRDVGWPRCGEIDIMEFVGHDPNRIHATVHYGPDGEHRSQKDIIEVDAPYNDFHVYAIEWTEERIDFFFNDTKYHTVDLDIAGEGEDNAFRRPHYLLINLALGGSWGWDIDDDNLPQQYLIDYVRIYREREQGQ